MTSKDIALVARGIAEVERMVEDIPDPNGIGASTLRLVVDAIGGLIADRHPRFKQGVFEIEALPIGHARTRHAILMSVGGSWPYDDVAAKGVLNTVVDRGDRDAYVVFDWAASIGPDAYAEIVNDHDGSVEKYFTGLDAGDDLDDLLDGFDYDGTVGPAVDRVEDAFTQWDR